MRKSETLGSRLQAAMKAGELTPADLAKWFGRGYQTVYSWVYYGHEPQLSWRAETYRRLALLEKAVKRRKGALVPYDVKQADRGRHIQEAYRRVS